MILEVHNTTSNIGKIQISVCPPTRKFSLRPMLLFFILFLEFIIDVHNTTCSIRTFKIRLLCLTGGHLEPIFYDDGPSGANLLVDGSRLETIFG